MLDISKHKIDFPCPSCKRKLKASLQQIANQSSVKCPSCSETIQLKDKGGSAKRGLNDMNKAFKSLENTIKKIGSKR